MAAQQSKLIFIYYSPIEKTTTHDVMVKFFPWPGMRNQMIFNQDMFRSDEFLYDLKHDTLFLFSSLNEAFFFDEASNRFAFTPEWQARRNDLTCYTCSSDFLHKYPQLRSAIPVSTASLRKIQPTGLASGFSTTPSMREKRICIRGKRKLEGKTECDDANHPHCGTCSV